MVKKWCRKLPEKFNEMTCDEFIVMPNHFHGIIIINGSPIVGAIPCNRPVLSNNHPDPNGMIPMGENGVSVKGENMVSPLRGLGRYISWFKRMTTNEYIRGVKSEKWTPFERKLWQRNYYEHVIRDENELNRIRKYIGDNTAQWDTDDENPLRYSRPIPVRAIHESSNVNINYPEDK